MKKSVKISVDKTYCDFCKKEITDESYFVITRTDIFRPIKEFHLHNECYKLGKVVIDKIKS